MADGLGGGASYPTAAVAEGVTVIVSCEHAGNEIPPEHAHLFDSSPARRALESHRGWDPGSLEIAEGFASVLDAPLIVQRVSRLLVECNRSLDHPRLFSEFSRGLGEVERAEVLARYWRRHRERVRGLVRSAPIGPMVVHVGVHTFTPVWKGRERTTRVGLLYDPRRAAEAGLARRWREALVARLPDDLQPAHLNRPYRGWTDGLTTTLRRELPASRYVGMELEVSQGVLAPKGGRPEMDDGPDMGAGLELGRTAGRALMTALAKSGIGLA